MDGLAAGFDFGLQRVLDGIQAYVESGAAPRAHSPSHDSAEADPYAD